MVVRVALPAVLHISGAEAGNWLSGVGVFLSCPVCQSQPAGSVVVPVFCIRGTELSGMVLRPPHHPLLTACTLSAGRVGAQWDKSTLQALEQWALGSSTGWGGDL